MAGRLYALASEPSICFGVAFSSALLGPLPAGQSASLKSCEVACVLSAECVKLALFLPSRAPSLASGRERAPARPGVPASQALGVRQQPGRVLPSAMCAVWPALSLPPAGALLMWLFFSPLSKHHIGSIALVAQRAAERPR